LEVAFQESAPRDIFTLSNKSVEGWSVEMVAVKLKGSFGRLLFDTEASGPGVQVYQPFEQQSGSALLVRAPQVADGDESLQMQFQGFGPGNLFTFTIDVDDRLPLASAQQSMGQTMISDAEIAGATVEVAFVDPAGNRTVTMAEFEEDSIARVNEGVCS